MPGYDTAQSVGKTMSETKVTSYTHVGGDAVPERWRASPSVS
jgi:hypothetical protein